MWGQGLGNSYWVFNSLKLEASLLPAAVRLQAALGLEAGILQVVSTTWVPERGQLPWTCLLGFGFSWTMGLKNGGPDGGMPLKR